MTDEQADRILVKIEVLTQAVVDLTRKLGKQAVAAPPEMTPDRMLERMKQSQIHPGLAGRMLQRRGN